MSWETSYWRRGLIHIDTCCDITILYIKISLEYKQANFFIYDLYKPRKIFCSAFCMVCNVN